MDRYMIDAASGGVLYHKTPAAARGLIANMAENSQQFGTRMLTTGVNEAQTSSIEQSRIENKINELTSVVRQLAMGKQENLVQVPRVCGICTSPTHPTDACSTLQEENSDFTAAPVAGIWHGRPQ